ncbi:MAG: tetratricopeptide repeat protein [Fibrella sp.]|nr:tetratricopeptide repeat protein [Armatimonadota bacterium]
MLTTPRSEKVVIPTSTVPQMPTAGTVGASDLAITLFGPMQVLLYNRPLPRLRSRKALWLLALLTLRHGRPVERGWLAGTLWPDVGESQSSASLRAVLSELRSALGGQCARLQSPSRHTISLDLSDAAVDMLAFDAAVASGDLKGAVALYNGFLLEGCTEEWVAQERAKREQDCLQALQKLATDAIAVGDHITGTAYWQRAVNLDPLWEAARRGLMEGLDRSGDRNAALHVYREFVGIIQRDDPKSAPAEETTALYRRLRAQAHQQASNPVKTTGVSVAPVVRGSLPDTLTELIGREDECAEVAAQLRRSRLVTLTGPGGIGKTRLAVAVAGRISGEYRDGAWLVALESLSDPDLVPQTVARVLGVQEETRRPLAQTLAESLKGKHLLLVLDNCEHLLQASAELSEHLLRQCAGMRVLATSREALGVTGEMAWAVPPLSVPDPDHLPRGQSTLVRVLAGYEGVQLFVERAQAVQKTFELTVKNASAVARICSRLEGVPLALELAAVRVKAMTAEQIAERLGDHLTGQLGLLTGGSRTVLSRQQTLRATLDWSYILLNDPERLLLHRLSVFAGGWDLPAAEQVCAGKGTGANIAPGQILNLLASLVDKSLVTFAAEQPEGAAEAATGGRYRLLEMVRQYASEKLEASGESAAIKDRHTAWFLSLAEETEPHLRGSEPETYLRRLETDYDNFQAALVWSATGTEEPEWGMRLAGALWWFWKIRGRNTEGRQYLNAALERAGGETVAQAKAVNAAGALALNQGDYAASQSLHERSLQIYRNLGDRQGVASVLNNLGNLASHQSKLTMARAFLEESLGICRESNDIKGVSKALSNLGNVMRLLGDYASARACHEECLEIRRSLGDKHGVAHGLANLGNVARLQGDHSTSRALLEESLELRRAVGDIEGVAYTLSHLGTAATTLGDFASARMLYEESLRIRRELGQTRGIAWSLVNLGVVALYEGITGAARTLFEESLSLFRGLNDDGGIAWSLNHLGDVAYRHSEFTQAQAWFEESLNLFRTAGDREGVAENLRDMAAVFGDRKDVQKAARLWGAAEALRENIGAPLPPVEQERYDRQVARIRSSGDSSTFAAAWREGRTLTWEQATIYALGK